MGYNKKNKKYNYNHNTFKRKIPSTPIPNPSDPDLSPSAFRLGPEESDSDSSFDHSPFNNATKSSSKTNQKRFLNRNESKTLLTPASFDNVHCIKSRTSRISSCKKRKSCQTPKSIQSSLIDHEDEYDPPRPSLHSTNTIPANLNNINNASHPLFGCEDSQNSQTLVKCEGQIICTVVEEDNDDESGLDV